MSRSTKAARLEIPESVASVFAQKGEPLAAPAERGEPRTVTLPRLPPEPAPQDDQEERRVATTIAFPAPVMRRIQERLRQDQQHNLRSLVLYALNEIGVYVEPEYMKPIRRRWTR